MTPRSADEESPPDYRRFCTGVRTLLGVELRHYRAGQMERRLRSFAHREGHPDLDAYLARLRRDVAARESFLDRMTINVSELFRNPERFADLATRYLPELLAGAPHGLRLWSAGCSYGAEPYSLAVLLREVAPDRCHELLATDIDRTMLARARAGRFSEADVRGVDRGRRGRYFEPRDDGEPGAQARAELRRSIRFSRLDLLTDPYPASVDLILCRNVVIYLTEEAKAGIFSRFLASLRPGGILLVGSTERVDRAERIGWERAGTFFYRRPR